MIFMCAFKQLCLLLLRGPSLRRVSNRKMIYTNATVGKILHVYVNIWTPAKEGWQSLRMRHMVNQKMNALPNATQEEIEDLRDICAICLDELKAAKVTPCKHYFHTMCLKKWLNVQNKCPMCHTTIVH